MGQEFGINIWKYSKEKYQHIESNLIILITYWCMIKTLEQIFLWLIIGQMNS